LRKEKFEFFTGKLFELYYSDMKIIENKINLNYNLMETEVLLGTHFQLNGCLVVKDYPKKFYFYDRKKIFQFTYMTNFHENKTLNAVSFRKFISSDVKKSVFFFQNFHFFYNFKSRLNSAFFEKSWNIKINRKKDYDLYFREKKNCLVIKCGFLRNHKIIESRRKRIFNLQIKSKILKNIHGKEGKFSPSNFQKGFLKCMIFSRFFSKMFFLLSADIVFCQKNFQFELNICLFNWFIQLKRENYFGSLKTYPFSKYFYIKELICSQAILISTEIAIVNGKNFKTTRIKKFIGFSLLKNELNWNTTFSIYALALDFFLHIKRLESKFDYKWNYITQLALFYLFSNKFRIYLTRIKLNKNFNFHFFSTRQFQNSNNFGWINIIFDTTNFYKKKKNFMKSKTNVSDIFHTNKVLRFLEMKNWW
jgi:hypothetical protein